MIRINLLPEREEKAREWVRFQLTLAGLSVFFVICLCILFYISLVNEVNALNDDIAVGEEELAGLKDKIKDLAKVKAQKLIFESKFKIILELEDKRAGPTELLTKLSNAVPDNTWITSLRDLSGTLEIIGYSATQDDVVDFMRGLKRQKDFGEVDLLDLKKSKVSQYNREFEEFKLKVSKRL